MIWRIWLLTIDENFFLYFMFKQKPYPKKATKYDIPVIKRQLVFDLWARRTEKDLRLTDQMIQQYRYLPFEQLQIKFVGFQGDQLFQLEEELLANGGEVWNDENDRKSTNYLYIVRNDYPKDDSFLYDDLDKIVMEEWFWSCIQVTLG